MTDKVHPSRGRKTQSVAMAHSAKYGAGRGWVVPSTDSIFADDAESGISGAPLNRFNIASIAGRTVTLMTGEAFVGGAWLARDTQTSVTIPSGASNYTIFVGWDVSATDAVIVGPIGDFASDDPTLPLWTFDADATSITNQTDERYIGASNTIINRKYDTDTDGSIENAHVDGLQNFGAADQFTGYPIDQNDINEDLVEASETNDASDITRYRMNNVFTSGGYNSLVNVSGTSGVLLGGFATCGDPDLNCRLTVDSGTPFTTGNAEARLPNATSMYLIEIPAVRFQNSLAVGVGDPGGSVTHNVGAMAWVKT